MTARKREHTYWRTGTIVKTVKEVNKYGTVVTPFLVYKKAKVSIKGKLCNAIITLELPTGAKTNIGHANHDWENWHKFRADKARVIEIRRNNSFYTKAQSKSEPSFLYEIGETVKVKDFDLSRKIVCSTGIHFFLIKEEALAYNWS